jgi:WD40 repeat protein
MAKLVHKVEELDVLLSGEKGNFDDFFDAVLAKPLLAALKTSPKTGDVFILLDALDELHPGPSRQQLLRLLTELPKLSPRVRLVVTSRSEADTEAHLQALSPLMIDKQADKQLVDLRLYAQQSLVVDTSLRDLAQAQQASVVEKAVTLADGNFLALSHIVRTIVERDAELDGTRSLKVKDVNDVLEACRSRASSSVLDGAYADLLNRTKKRFADAADGNPSVDSALNQALQEVLATLLAQREPLRLSEVFELCGGACNRGESLVANLLGELSLLFSASGATSTVEPLHKTVVDFLRDKQRSGEHWVDESEGHAALALASLRVIRGRGLLDTKKLVDAEHLRCDGVLQYALKHGHMHLMACVARSSKNRACRDALEAWESAFVEDRILPDVLPTDYVLSTKAATPAFAMWLLAEAHTGERTRQLPDELRDLAGALRMLGGRSLGQLIQESSRVYSLQYLQGEGTSQAVGRFLGDVPLTGFLWQSRAAICLRELSHCGNMLMRIPGISAFGKSDMLITGHHSAVASVAVSPSAQQIASVAIQDNLVRVWDAASGKPTLTLEHERSTSVFTVAYCPEGKYIVSGGSDGTVHVWDASTGSSVQTLKGHSDAVTSAAFSHDGTTIVSGSTDKTVKIWDVSSGDLLQTLKGHTDAVTCVTFTPNGQQIASGSADNSLRVWDVSSGKRILHLQGHNSDILSVAVSPNGRCFVAGSKDGNVSLWDAAKGGLVNMLQGHRGHVNAVCFSPDGRLIVSGGEDKTVRMWDVKSGSVLRTLERHRSAVTSVAFSPDSTYIVSGGRDYAVAVWDVPIIKKQMALKCHHGGVRAVSYSQDGLRIVSGSVDKTVRVWHAGSGDSIFTLKGHRNFVASVAFSPDGAWIVSGSGDKTVRVWDATTGKRAHTLKGHTSDVTSVAFSPDGALIASGGVDKTVRVWDAKTGAAVRTLEGHRNYVNCVAFSPDGKQIVSGSVDKTVRVWDATTGKKLQSFSGHSGAIVSVVFHPSGTRIVSGSDDSTLCIWDLAGAKKLHTLKGHSSSVTSVIYSPDGERIVSSSFDKTVRVWDASTTKQLHVMQGHNNGIWSAVYSPDGCWIASGSYDKTVRVWDADSSSTAQPLQTHSSFVAANTPEEEEEDEDEVEEPVVVKKSKSKSGGCVLQ